MSWNNATLDAHNSNMKALLDLDETSGNRWDKINAGGWIPSGSIGYDTGKLGNAIKFVAADLRYCGNQYELTRNKTKISVSCWIKLASLGTNQIVFAEFTSVSSGRCWLYSDTANKLTMGMRDTGGSPIIKASTNTLSSGTWYHVLAVWDTVADKQYAWVDGIEWINESVTMSNFDNSVAAIKCRLGASVSSSYMDGLIDQFVLWDEVALDIDDAEELYNGGSGLYWNQDISPTGFSTAITFGTVVVAGPVNPTGLDVPVSFGSPIMGVSILPDGIAQSVSFGNPTITKYRRPKPLLVPPFFRSDVVLVGDERFARRSFPRGN